MILCINSISAQRWCRFSVYERLYVLILTNVGIKACKWCYFYAKKSFDLVVILSKVDWVVTSPCSTDHVAPVRATNENDATWATKERDFESQKDSPMTFVHRKWVTANKKYLAVIKNMIEPAIVGLILECDMVTEYLDRIKSQFTDTSKKYATQIVAPVRETKENDATWATKERDFESQNISYGFLA